MLDKPVAIEEYNAKMGAADCLDQRLGSYMDKSMKWYHTLFHRAYDTALSNGYISYTQKNKDISMTAADLCKKVVDGLLSEYTAVQIPR